MKTSLLKSAVLVAGIALCAPVALHAQMDSANPIATSPVKNPPMDSSSSMSTTSSTSSKKMSKIMYKGTVKSIDASSVVVTTSKGDMTFTVDDKTKVLVDKKKAAASDITVGEKVSGSYMKNDDGTMCACSIHGHSK